MSRPVFRRSLATLLNVAISIATAAAQPPVPAQKPSRVDLGTVSGQLRLVVLRGRNEVHLTTDQSQKFIVVEVLDDNDLPIEGAEVSFEMPASGPGGRFTANRTQTTTRSTGQGQAAALFTPNQQPGKYQIEVRATLGARTGTLSVPQMIASRGTTSSMEPKKGFFTKKKIILLSLIGGGAAAAGIVLATRNGGPVPVTIVPGAPVFGGPR